MVGDWVRVQRVVNDDENNSPSFAIGRLLLAMKDRDNDTFHKSLASGFMAFGGPITSSGRHSYKSSYDSMVKLHVLHELKMFFEKWNTGTPCQVFPEPLTSILRGRLESVLPSFKTREIILSYRRAAYALQYVIRLLTRFLSSDL